MSRIWWATIAGLIVGAALLAMVQRGCSAGADIDPDRRVDAPTLSLPSSSDPAAEPRDLSPVVIAPATPNLGAYDRRRTEPAPAERRVIDTAPEPPSIPAVERGKTRDEIREEAIARREAYQRQAEERRRERERRQAESRRIALELAQQSGRLSERDAARVRNNQVLSRDAQQAAEEARRQFRQQVTNPGGARGGRNAAGDGASGDRAAGERSADDAGADADSGSDLDSILDGLPEDARRALEDLGGIPSGAQGSRGGGSGQGQNPQRADTRYGGNDFPSIEELAPIPVWEPVARGRAADGRRVSSADLYLGFVIQPSIPVISSPADSGLTASGGTFFAGRAAVTEVAPTAPETVVSAEPSPLLLTSSVTLGGAAPFFTPGSVQDPAQWGQSIAAEWSSTDFGGIRFVQDPDRFGDERFYLRVGRFTVTEDVYAVGGTLGVTWVDLASFASVQVDVAVPSCTTCWLGEAPDDGGGETPGEGENPSEPGLAIASVSISPATLSSGQSAQGSVRLSAPAPAGGATIQLSSADQTALSVSSQSLTIPEGQLEASFTLAAGDVAEAVTIAVSLAYDGVITERRVTVLPATAVFPELDRITIVPQQILGGLTAQGRLRLLEAAPAGGVTIDLASSSSSAIVPDAVAVPAGAASVLFDIQTLAVAADSTVMITAQLGSQQRAADLVIKAEVFGDVNRDGIVDGFDLAALLAATVGDYLEDADLDNDGDVDLDDLAVLVDLLESRGGVGQNPAVDAPIVARWVPVAREDCEEITAYRSADLYLGYLEVPTLASVTSAPEIGLTIEGGAFYQHPLGGNAPPNMNLVDVVPCLRFDSYLTLGETDPFFTPTFPVPTPDDWGQTLVAEWFPTPGVAITTVQDPDRFGDDRFYVRIARITVPIGTRSLTGKLETITITSGGPPVDRDVTVYHCSSCWGQYDLNSDGVVSDLDLEIMISLLGEEDPAADLDADGAVDLDDLRLLIAAIGS